MADPYSLNPNHPVTRAISDHWHKLTALVMQKQGLDRIVISASDIANMPEMFITVQELPDGLHLRLVDKITAARLAAMAGGLPT